MTGNLQRYKSVDYPLPAVQRSWFLFGPGMDKLGRDGLPIENSLPLPGPDELLVRCDATGLCFSDVKVIAQGSDHVRLKGRDLSQNPVILGHEAVVTVVAVGANLHRQFRIGERYVVQADIYVGGKTFAYGYVLPGALTQYETIGREVLHGDDGCYLLPVKETTGYAQAALTEPWACVVHSYALNYRRSVKAGGACLLIGGRGAEKLLLGATFTRALPRRIFTLDLPVALQSAVENTGVKVTALVGDGGDAAFDDIIVCGALPGSRLEKLSGRLARGGVFNLVTDCPPDAPVALDVGRIHYEDWCFVGNPGPDIGASYRRSRSLTELADRGTAWFLGAGGPMGQMHVQRACETARGPRLLLATEIDAGRVRELRERFIPAAAAHGRTLVVLNPRDFRPAEFAARLGELTGGRGFDDVVALAPSAELVAEAAKWVADDGLLNIFAGVGRGTKCALDLGAMVRRGVRWVGSSGSSIADMRETLRMAESGALLTADAVAAIGGLNAAYRGLELVKARAVPGKIVIYPQLPELPLTFLTDLPGCLPSVAARLRDGKFWTVEAEEELFRLWLRLPG